MTTTIIDELFNENVRVDLLLWIPLMGTDDAPTEMLADFCMWLPEKDNALYEALPMLREFKDADDYPSAEQIVEALFYTKGFLMNVSTPVRKYYGDGSAFHYSWGHVWQSWTYGLTPEDAGFAALEWAKKRAENDRKVTEAA